MRRMMLLLIVLLLVTGCSEKPDVITDKSELEKQIEALGNEIKALEEEKEVQSQLMGSITANQASFEEAWLDKEARYLDEIDGLEKALQEGSVKDNQIGMTHDSLGRGLITLELSPQTLKESMCEKLGFESDRFDIVYSEGASKVYTLVYTGEASNGVESIGAMLNTKTGHIYESISEKMMANILFSRDKEAVEEDEIKGMLMAQVIKELPAASELFFSGYDKGDVLFSVSEKEEGKYIDTKLYRINPLTGEVNDEFSGDYVTDLW